MSLEYIRRYYDVPAYRDRRVRYTGGKEPREGVITNSFGQYLRIRFDGETETEPGKFHPTWKIEYL